MYDFRETVPEGKRPLPAAKARTTIQTPGGGRGTAQQPSDPNGDNPTEGLKPK